MELYTNLIEFNWTMLFIWMTVLVLYLILKRFFFEKIHNFMEARANQVKESFENADRVNAMAEEKLQAYNQKLAEIEAEGQNIIREARKKADMQAKQILEDANKRANEMIRQAEEEIEKKQLQAIVEMKSQIAELAMLAAEKVLEQQLNVYGQDALVDQIIEEVGKSAWQN
ncbi:MAG TPA: F0F1 ATP synthase subunit B [Bacillota bacterium]|nr:F0F1 ATP synthase subunit B [Bacillota bacterium]HQC82312.1 F0F1 ATP synthase subunit B [Bacillota bacterium]